MADPVDVIAATLAAYHDYNAYDDSLRVGWHRGEAAQVIEVIRGMDPETLAALIDGRVEGNCDGRSDGLPSTLHRAVGLWRGWLSPDCRDAAKHRACAGQALDPVSDEVVPCACNCHRPSTDALLGVGADWLDGATVDEFMDQIRGEGT